LGGKSIGPGISDCGFRISDFLVFFFNPHSAICNPQFRGGRSYNRLTWFLGEEKLARPTQKMNRASWFFRPMTLLSTRATPEIESIFRLFGKKGKRELSKEAS